MAFYDLSPASRKQLAEQIAHEIEIGIRRQQFNPLRLYYSDHDTYIRKSAYIATGRIYLRHPELQYSMLNMLKVLLDDEEPKIRQTTVNAAGEIGMFSFTPVSAFFDTALFDPHHSVRNAVIGSVKKMGEKNPTPVLKWAAQYLHHPDKEIRREICHGIELRGRKHPEDILPLLQQLEFDGIARVRNTLIHVIGQISYKKGCLEKVIAALNNWKNETLITAAIAEIIDVHYQYRNFSYYTQEEAIAYIQLQFRPSSPLVRS